MAVVAAAAAAAAVAAAAVVAVAVVAAVAVAVVAAVAVAAVAAAAVAGGELLSLLAAVPPGRLIAQVGLSNRPKNPEEMPGLPSCRSRSRLPAGAPIPLRGPYPSQSVHTGTDGDAMRGLSTIEVRHG